MEMILVTGGAGFIGGNFVLDWLKDPAKEGIINLDKLTYAGNLENLKDIEHSDNYTFVKGDITDAALLKELFDESFENKKHELYNN